MLCEGKRHGPVRTGRAESLVFLVGVVSGGCFGAADQYLGSLSRIAWAPSMSLSDCRWVDNGSSLRVARTKVAAKPGTVERGLGRRRAFARAVGGQVLGPAAFSACRVGLRDRGRFSARRVLCRFEVDRQTVNGAEHSLSL